MHVERVAAEVTEEMRSVLVRTGSSSFGTGLDMRAQLRFIIIIHRQTCVHFVTQLHRTTIRLRLSVQHVRAQHHTLTDFHVLRRVHHNFQTQMYTTCALSPV